MLIQSFMSAKRVAAPATLALMIAIGLPAHAGGTTTAPTLCSPITLTTLTQLLPTAVKCDPTPVKSNPTPVSCLPTLTQLLPTLVKCDPTPVSCTPLPVKCDPTPISCAPVPVQCSPAPQCGPKAAVPEPASVALVGVGAMALLPMGMRALKSRRQLG